MKLSKRKAFNKANHGIMADRAAATSIDISSHRILCAVKTAAARTCDRSEFRVHIMFTAYSKIESLQHGVQHHGICSRPEPLNHHVPPFLRLFNRSLLRPLFFLGEHFHTISGLLFANDTSSLVRHPRIPEPWLNTFFSLLARKSVVHHPHLTRTCT